MEMYECKQVIEFYWHWSKKWRSSEPQQYQDFHWVVKTTTVTFGGPNLCDSTHKNILQGPNSFDDPTG